MSVLLTMVRSFFQGSSGSRLLGPRSKSRPAAAGDHIFFCSPYRVHPAAPWTISRQASRSGGFFVCGVIAGSMDSRNGSATVAPMPRSTVLREIAFLVMNILLLLLLLSVNRGRFGLCSTHLKC